MFKFNPFTGRFDRTSEIPLLPIHGGTGSTTAEFSPTINAVTFHYYVNSATGSDSNDGLTVGTPFLTIEKALNSIPLLMGRVYQINIADGTDNLTAKYTFKTSSSVSGDTDWGGKVIIYGNPTTPGNVVINALNTSTTAIEVEDKAVAVEFNGITISNCNIGVVANNARVIFKNTNINYQLQALQVGYASQVTVPSGNTGMILTSDGVSAVSTGIVSTVGSSVILQSPVTITGFKGANSGAINVLLSSNVNVITSLTITADAAGARYGILTSQGGQMLISGGTHSISNISVASTTSLAAAFAIGATSRIGFQGGATLNFTNCLNAYQVAGTISEVGAVTKNYISVTNKVISFEGSTIDSTDYLNATGGISYTEAFNTQNIFGYDNRYVKTALGATGGTLGSVAFFDSAGKISQNNSKFFWDNTAFQLQLNGGSTLKLAGGTTSGAGNIQMGAVANLAYDTNVLHVDSNARTMGMICSVTPAFSSTLGPFMGMRGITYTAIANQRGNAFLYAGTPTTPGALEGRLLFGTADTERMTILYGGNVGIGTSAPTSKFHVAMSDATTTIFTAIGQEGMRFQNTNSTVNNWTELIFSNSGGNSSAAIAVQNLAHVSQSGRMILATGQSGTLREAFRIDEAGNAVVGGFGISPAAVRLYVNGSIATGVYSGSDFSSQLGLHGTAGFNNGSTYIQFTELSGSGTLNVNKGGNIDFYTHLYGATTAIRARLQANGHFLVGTTTDTTFAQAKIVSGTGVEPLALMNSVNSGFAFVHMLDYLAADAAGFGYANPSAVVHADKCYFYTVNKEFFISTDNTTTRHFKVDTSGRAAVGMNTTALTSTFHINGSFAPAYVAKTADYTATASDHTIDCTANTFTVTLPAAAGCTGRIYNIKNSGTGTITVDGNASELIDGSLTITIPPGSAGAYPNLQIQSTGTGWIIL